VKPGDERRETGASQETTQTKAMKKIQLHVAQPCHENWDNMTAADQGRFCASCEKQVVDFTMMSDREIAEFFKKKSTGSVCGRFMNEQLDRPIEIPKKRIPWVKYFFQFTIPAMLLSLKAGAQRRTMGIPLMVKEKNDTPRVAKPAVPDSIQGIVYNEKGEPVPFAKVCIKDTSSSTIADSNGRFELKPPVVDWVIVGDVSEERAAPDTSVLQIIAPGYIDSMVNVTFKTQPTLKILMWPDSLLKGMTVGFMTIEYKGPIWDIDYPTPAPTVYPNPAAPGQTITVEWENGIPGKVIIRVNTLEGKEVLAQSFETSEGKNKIPIRTSSSWTRGFYIISLFDPKGKKMFGEKIVIQ
jgi:hypothetical protein